MHVGGFNIFNALSYAYHVFMWQGKDKYKIQKNYV